MDRISSLVLALFLLIHVKAAVGADFSAILPRPESTEVSADFDGDSKPDLAIGSRAGSLGYMLEIRFSSEIPSAFLSLANAGSAVKVVVCDVNRDSDPDLVIQGAASVFPLAVWLSDGKGHFRRGTPWHYLPSRADFRSRSMSDQGHREQWSILPKKRLDANRGRAVQSTPALVERQSEDTSPHALALDTHDRRNPGRSPPSLL